MSQSLDDPFVELVQVDNAGFAVGMSTLSVVIAEIYVFPVLAAIFLFLVVGRCCSHLPALPFLGALYTRKSQICHRNFSGVSYSFSDIKVFPVSAAVSGCRSLLESPTVTFFELAEVENPRFTVGILTI